MRAMFGLVGILVTIGVIAMIWSYTVPATIQSGQVAQSQAQQIAGIDQSGERVSQTLYFQPMPSQGKLRYLLVQKMAPGNSYGTFYGIAQGDLIETIGPQNVRDIGDEDMSKALAYEAYQRQWDLVIVRNQQRFTLPRDKALAAGQLPAPAAMAPPAGAPAAAAPAAAAPAPAPAPAPQRSGNALTDQLDAIRNYNAEK